MVTAAGPGSSLRAFFGKLGPGLLMAGTAVGVSHLVQATRAGADFGYQLLVIVLLVNLAKYPFFEFGHRYAVASGENLLVGYARLGRAYLYLFLALNLASALGGIAGVTFVTAGLLQHLVGAIGDATAWSVIVMGGCIAVLWIGRYVWLDHGIKAIMAVLSVATVSAVLIAWGHGPVAAPGHPGASAWAPENLPFLIALMGWMPAPIEVSVWQSLWIEANEQRTGRKTTFAAAKVDFNVGYGLTVALAVCFLSLGALVMFGSGIEVQSASGAFAAQLVSLYRQTLGGWAGPLIAVAALTTMVSTTLTVIDAYPRSFAVGTRLVASRLRTDPRTLYGIWLIGCCLMSLVIISTFLNRLTELIDLATTIAFLAAPFYAYFNYRLITSDHTAAHMRPSRPLRWLSAAGLAFLGGFGLLFLVYRYAPGVFG